MNIVRRIRVEHSLTQKELAERAKVTTQVVLRAEQFLPPRLPQSLSTALSEISDEGNLHHINAEYVKGRIVNLQRFAQGVLADRKFLKDTVREAIDYAIDYYVPPYQTSAVGDNYHPFRLFRVRAFSRYKIETSQIQFCIRTGLHPAIISDLELGKTSFDVHGDIGTFLVHTFLLSDAQVGQLKVMCDNSVG